MLVAPFDPHNLRLAPLLPELPLEFPSLIVTSRNDPYMRLDRAAFWAGFWSSDFLSIGAAGGIDPESGFGPWPQGLELLERFKQLAAAHTYRSATGRRSAGPHWRCNESFALECEAPSSRRPIHATHACC